MLSWGWGCWGCWECSACPPSILLPCLGHSAASSCGSVPFRCPLPAQNPAAWTSLAIPVSQRMQQTNVALLGRETVGNWVSLRHQPPAPNPPPPDLTSPLSTLLVQEPSGFSLNNPSYVRAL